MNSLSARSSEFPTKHERCYTRRAHETKALRGELTAYLTRKAAATTYRPTRVPPTILRRASVHPKVKWTAQFISP